MRNRIPSCILSLNLTLAAIFLLRILVMVGGATVTSTVRLRSSPWRNVALLVLVEQESEMTRLVGVKSPAAPDLRAAVESQSLGRVLAQDASTRPNYCRFRNCSTTLRQ